MGIHEKIIHSIKGGKVMNPRKVFAITMILCMILAGGFTTGSEAAPSANFTQTIRILVPFNAGGSTDLLARLLAPEMSSRLGVPVIVENKPGGGGAIGMNEMIQSRPDGHTLILCSVNAACLTPNMSDVGYTNKEMTPISQLTQVSTGILVHADSGITNIEEFIAACEADYGTKTFCTTGTGSIHHLAAELFMQAIDKPGLMLHVPFNSGTEAITAVLGKQIDFTFGDAADGLSFVEEGELRAIAMAADPGRDSFFPDVPSFKELGYDIPQLGPWTALAAPAGTPAEIIAKLDETAKECMELPHIKEGLKNLSLAAAYMNHTDISIKWMTEYDQFKTLLSGMSF
jgi:tripartite-type tricarboxylate transporter receptor subunit TctC